MEEKFTNFIEERFGYSSVTVNSAVSAENQKPITHATSEEISIPITQATQNFMDRFSRVN